MATAKPGESLFCRLERVPDARSAQGRRFSLASILGLVIGAVVCGRRDLAGIARWAASLRKESDLLRQLGIERNATPCHATFHNVLTTLNVDALERKLGEWMRDLAAAGAMNEVAFDGKTLRGSASAGYAGLHLVTAYCHRIRGVARQMRMEGGMNEVTAALKLIRGIPLEGRIVTGDAIYANRRLCEEIVSRGGEYMFVMKEDKPGVLDDIRTAFEPSFSPLRGEKAPA